VNYTAGLAALASFAAVEPLPAQGFLWRLARYLLDAAGALFTLYLVVFLTCALAGIAMRRSARSGRPASSGIAP
jgi:hypothetical protein